MNGTPAGQLTDGAPNKAVSSGGKRGDGDGSDQVVVRGGDPSTNNDAGQSHDGGKEGINTGPGCLTNAADSTVSTHSHNAISKPKGSSTTPNAAGTPSGTDNEHVITQPIHMASIDQCASSASGETTDTVDSEPRDKGVSRGSESKANSSAVAIIGQTLPPDSVVVKKNVHSIERGSWGVRDDGVGSCENGRSKGTGTKPIHKTSDDSAPSESGYSKVSSDKLRSETNSLKASKDCDVDIEPITQDSSMSSRAGDDIIRSTPQALDEETSDVIVCISNVNHDHKHQSDAFASVGQISKDGVNAKKESEPKHIERRQSVLSMNVARSMSYGSAVLKNTQYRIESKDGSKQQITHLSKMTSNATSGVPNAKASVSSTTRIPTESTHSSLSNSLPRNTLSASSNPLQSARPVGNEVSSSKAQQSQSHNLPKKDYASSSHLIQSSKPGDNGVPSSKSQTSQSYTLPRNDLASSSNLAHNNELQSLQKTPLTMTNKTLLDLYQPFLSSKDKSLDDGRRRLHIALEQTRRLREAFTHRVYEKYRVVLKPVQKSVEEIINVSRLHPKDAYRRLVKHANFIKEEKEMEKREAERFSSELSAANSSGDTASASSVGGPNGVVENVEQLSWYGAGLSLVILPEEEYADEAELASRGVTYRGPLDPLTGHRVDGLSTATATAACSMLDRVRKGNELRVNRKRKHRQEGFTTVGSRGINHEVKQLPVSTPSKHQSTTSPAMTRPVNTVEIGRTKGNRTRIHNPSAANLLSLSPSVEGIGLSGRNCAASAALVSCGVGHMFGSKNGGKYPFHSHKSRDVYPESNVVSSIVMDTNTSSGSLDTGTRQLPPSIPSRKRQRQNPVESNIMRNKETNQKAENAVKLVLKQFLTQNISEEKEHLLKAKSNGRVKLKRHISEIGLFKNIREEQADKLKNHNLSGKLENGNGHNQRHSSIDPLLTLSVLHAIGLVTESPDSLNTTMDNVESTNIVDVLDRRGSKSSKEVPNGRMESSNLTEPWVGEHKRSITEEYNRLNISVGPVKEENQCLPSPKESGNSAVVLELRGGGDGSIPSPYKGNIKEENQDVFPLPRNDNTLSSLPLSVAQQDQMSRSSSAGQSSSSASQLSHQQHLQAQRHKNDYIHAALWGDQGRGELTSLQSQATSPIRHIDSTYAMIAQAGVRQEPVPNSLGQNMYSAPSDGITTISANPRMQGQHPSLSHSLSSSHDQYRHHSNSSVASHQLHLAQTSLQHATAALHTPLLHHTGDLDYFTNSIHHGHQPSSNYATDWAAIGAGHGLSVLPTHSSLSGLTPSQAMVNLSVRDRATALLTREQQQPQACTATPKNTTGSITLGTSNSSPLPPSRLFQSELQNESISSSRQSNHTTDSITLSTSAAKESDTAASRVRDHSVKVLSSQNQNREEGQKKLNLSGSGQKTSVLLRENESKKSPSVELRGKKKAVEPTIIVIDAEPTKIEPTVKHNTKTETSKIVSVSQAGPKETSTSKEKSVELGDKISKSPAKESREQDKETTKVQQSKEQLTALEARCEESKGMVEVKEKVSGSTNVSNKSSKGSEEFAKPSGISQKHKESQKINGSRSIPVKSSGLVFLKPHKPEVLSNEEANLILSGYFHFIKVKQIGDDGYISDHKNRALVEYLLAVAAAIPIPKAMISNPLKERLSPSSIHSTFGSILSIREAISSIVTIWLWSNHREAIERAFARSGRVDVDTHCKWLVTSAIETSSRALVDDVLKRTNKGKDEKATPSHTNHIDTTYRIASLISRTLMKGLCLNVELDAALPNIDQMLSHLDQLRMCALRARSQERAMIASLVSRRTRMSESFSHAYTSAMVRAGEAFGHEDLCDIVQHEETLTSSYMPFDILNDSTGAWEDPCRPGLGFIPGLNGDELNKRAHARALLQKSLKKLQDRHSIKGGTPSAGCYSDTGVSGASKSGASNVTNTNISPSKNSPLISRSSSGLKRKASTSDTFGNFQSYSTNMITSICNPTHYSSPFDWDENFDENTPFGRYEGNGDMSSRMRSMSDARMSLLGLSHKRQRLNSSPGIDMKEDSVPSSAIRNTQEIHWTNVASMFQPVSISGNDRSSTLKMKSNDANLTRKSNSGEPTIFAPFCRKISGEDAPDSSDDESDSEEDLSDERMLENHQVVLDNMKEKFDAMMAIRKQYQDRSRQRSNGR